MRLEIDGEWHDLVPLAAFRTRFQLPQNFGIALFEPKDYTGLGCLSHAGDALQRLQHETLTSISSNLQWIDLFQVLNLAQQAFETALVAVNPSVGLRPVEIDFAVSGFDDLCQRFSYELIRLNALHLPISDDLPQTIYHDWLNSSVRVSSQKHIYSHQGMVWQLQILNTIYGRVGFRVQLPDDEMVYVHDSLYTCPADDFMLRLFMQLTKKVIEALRREATGKSS
jgi:hypothetical protein